MDLKDLYSLTGFEVAVNKEEIKPKTKENPTPKKEIGIPNKIHSKENKLDKKKTNKINLEHEELPSINLDELEDKQLVLTYYENLPKKELNRLEDIVDRKYNRHLTK